MKKLALRLVSFAAPLALTATAFAQDAADGGAPRPPRLQAARSPPGSAIGIAAFGCGMGQGRAAAAALEGIARNPNASGKILVPLILGLALIESLAIYALVIAFAGAAVGRSSRRGVPVAGAPWRVADFRHHTCDHGGASRTRLHQPEPPPQGGASGRRQSRPRVRRARRCVRLAAFGQRQSLCVLEAGARGDERAGLLRRPPPTGRR